MHGDQPTRKRCGAKNRPGAKHKICQAWAVPGRTRCRRHGGLTPKGPDSPHWIHGNGAQGKAGREQPNFRALFQKARTDPELFHFRKDAALLEAAREQILASLKMDKQIPAAALKKLLDLGDQLRKVKEAEHRRLQVLGAMVPVERHRRAMALTSQVVADVLRERGQALVDLVLNTDPDKLKALLLPHLNTRAWAEDMVRRYRVAALREPSIDMEALTEHGDERAE